ncbi:MAG: hypothetical protein WBC93_09255 [Sulfitobacter sp.]
MTQAPDPFVHHPELRYKTACSECSFHRNFNIEGQDVSRLTAQLAAQSVNPV